jgi:hypothetical protein
MAEGTPSPFPSERHRSDESPRGERSPGPREGGFRIRLSDNEMRSARALQEAFGLRSTVAVLGFALRTLGQQLEEGKLAELVELHRSQAPARGGSGDGGGRSEGRRERPEGRGGGGGRGLEGRGGGGAGRTRVDPFARPPRPDVTPEPTPEADVPAEDQATAVEGLDTPAVAEALPDETPSPAAEAAEAAEAVEVAEAPEVAEATEA